MLSKAEVKHAEALKNFVYDFEDKGNICGLAFYEKYQSAEEYLQVMMDWHEEKNLPDGIVGSTLYFWMEENEILGVIMLRHELNEFLERIGGHIGYSVSPSHRQKGIAKTMLEEMVQIARKDYHISTCLVSCAEHNIASKNTILTCGGCLVRKEAYQGNVQEMYEIGGQL